MILEELKSRFPESVRETSAPLGDETAVVEKDAFFEIARFLKTSTCQFDMLLDLTCVDNEGRTPRFEIVCHLYSITERRRIRIKTALTEDNPELDSLTPLWKNAHWLEREIFDMFGIIFKNHPDLRRILMYEGFEGHPLRKDYPLRRRQPRPPIEETDADAT